MRLHFHLNFCFSRKIASKSEKFKKSSFFRFQGFNLIEKCIFDVAFLTNSESSLHFAYNRHSKRAFYCISFFRFIPIFQNISKKRNFRLYIKHGNRCRCLNPNRCWQRKFHQFNTRIKTAEIYFQFLLKFLKLQTIIPFETKICNKNYLFFFDPHFRKILFYDFIYKPSCLLFISFFIISFFIKMT